MDKKESYQPSVEEIQKAEDSMTNLEKNLTHSREALMRNNSLKFSIRDSDLGMNIIFSVKETVLSGSAPLKDIANKLRLESIQKRTDENRVDKHIYGFHIDDAGKPQADVQELGGRWGLARMEDDTSIELTKPQAEELLDIIEIYLQRRRNILERDIDMLTLKMESEGVVDDQGPIIAGSNRDYLYLDRNQLNFVNLRLDVIANAREKLDKQEVN